MLRRWQVGTCGLAPHQRGADTLVWGDTVYLGGRSTSGHWARVLCAGGHMDTHPQCRGQPLSPWALPTVRPTWVFWFAMPAGSTVVLTWGSPRVVWSHLKMKESLGSNCSVRGSASLPHSGVYGCWWPQGWKKACGSLQSSRGDMVGKCVFLCLHSESWIEKINMTRKQITIHILMHILDRTCTWGHH